VRFPAVRERVKIHGRDEVFLVVSIDQDRGVADLIPVVEGTPPQEDVPLGSLQRLAEADD